MRSALLISLLIISYFFTVNSFAKWDNPAKRYLDEYKNHLDASCPIKADNIQHFVYLARDRDALKRHPALSHDAFSGMQIMYTWKELEPGKDNYDFSKIGADLSYVKGFGKQLFVQLQDTTFFQQYKAVPNYLLSEEYGGGATPQYDDNGKNAGWVALRWHPQVQLRLAKLLAALGERFDGKIAGINLQESAIDVSDQIALFTPERYADALKTNMLALKTSFPQSVTLQYANFMPGEWLPWDDKNYLRSIYAYGEEIGVGLGAPDLMIQRKPQLNHALAMMHETQYRVPLGIAIQDGNYIGRTGNTDIQAKRDNLVPILHSFAKRFLKVDYMFWVNQTPYFEEDVLPCFSE